MITRRKLMQVAGGAGISAMASSLAFGQDRTATGAQPAPDAHLYDSVNPEFRPALEKMMKDFSSMPELGDKTLPAFRQMMGGMVKPRLPSPTVQEVMVPGPAHAPQVKIFVIGATPGARKPLLFHTHGGGFVLGSAADDVPNLQKIALDHDCVVVTVEYRLAPETRLAGSLEDNYAALRWVHRHAKDLGVDVGRIALKGESAGGGHAAMLAIAVRDRREFKLCQQILIYPMLDDRTGSSRPVPAQMGRFMWTPAMNRYGWTSLLGVQAGATPAPANTIPARVTDVAGLPPTFIGVGSIDLFCMEDLEFANRLIAAGVSTEMDVVPGAYHGFDTVVPEAPLSVRFQGSWNAALKRAFAS